MYDIIYAVFSTRIKFGSLVMVFLTTILVINNLVSGRLFGGFWGTYALPSFLWIILALSIKFLLPVARPKTKVRYRIYFNWLGFLFAIAAILAAFAAGLLEGLGRSPYDHSFRGILINLFYLSSMLAGMELSRAWLINYAFKNRPVLGIALTGLLYTLFAFSLNRLTSLNSAFDRVRFAGNIFLPSLSENMLASYLAFLGGAMPAVLYRGTLFAFHWFLPLLPNLSWVVRALVGTFVPGFCMALLYQLYRSEVLGEKSREKESAVGWVLASTVSVVMIWFVVGVFNYFPNVIITGSMSPHIEVGDIVIVRRSSPEEVELGDVIQFMKDKKRINHRVIDIQMDERGLPLFVTQGDANKSPDSDPVLAEELVGKVVQIIPRVGWITIWLRSPG